MIEEALEAIPQGKSRGPCRQLAPSPVHLAARSSAARTTKKQSRICSITCEKCNDKIRQATREGYTHHSKPLEHDMGICSYYSINGNQTALRRRAHKAENDDLLPRLGCDSVGKASPLQQTCPKPLIGLGEQQFDESTLTHPNCASQVHGVEVLSRTPRTARLEQGTLKGSIN